MATDTSTARRAIEIGRDNARAILEHRALARARRARALAELPEPPERRLDTITPEGTPVAEPVFAQSGGYLMAEGDSWFDYPLHDVLNELEDGHGYDVESVAHKENPIEEMAYGSNQLGEFTRRIEKMLGRGQVPRAVLVSGGGNDVAGEQFGMLLNHANSAIAGFNAQILEGVIDVRVRTAYITMLSTVTELCKRKLGQALPILIHGYDFPV